MHNSILVRATRVQGSTVSRFVRSVRWHSLAAAFLAVGVTPCLADAKPWKGAEVITNQTFRYGAFEARIRAARGGGVITPFFLWKDGSEIPGREWQEQDFEVFGRDGTYQTQCMTPGTNGSSRTEHVTVHSLPTPAWERYYTYRMEWTPTQLAFYVDGQRVRVETDQGEYAKLLDPNRAEAAQMRLSIWAGDYEWSGAFDASAIPAAVFVNWVRTYSFTPGAGANGGDFTELWRDDFDADSGRFWRANWTFDAAINDYVPENAGLRNGYLVLVLTNEAGKGNFPQPPADDGLTPTPNVGEIKAIRLPARIEAESFFDAYDSTPGNAGAPNCSDSDVDAENTNDSNGGICNVGWTTPGEWLDYDVEVANDAPLDLVLRVASAFAGNAMHVEVDGIDVSGAIAIPAGGWQSFEDVRVRSLSLARGVHVVRLAFDTGDVNVNYLDFVATSGVPAGPPTCSPASHTYSAEAMQKTTGAAATGGWNLWSNGSASISHGFTGGDSIVTVNAWGQSASGIWPHMVVRVGDQVIGEVNVQASSYTPYQFFYAAPIGTRTVSVAFDNDYYQNGEDRNLYLSGISIEECP
ncbi:MAG TPA: family 16 glycosylhydrolase [Polyangiaceae bacterium]|nr:family 16 glycosylhydrolase [Polyangiaceae bacterium]